MRRFVQPDAQFHFIRPFDKVRYGTPFDLPEADIRRLGMKSATEVLLSENALDSDPRLKSLGRMAHLTEVSRWMLTADLEGSQLATEIRKVTNEACGETLNRNCLGEVLTFLDNWYSESDK